MAKIEEILCDVLPKLLNEIKELRNDLQSYSSEQLEEIQALREDINRISLSHEQSMSSLRNDMKEMANEHLKSMSSIQKEIQHIQEHVFQTDSGGDENVLRPGYDWVVEIGDVKEKMLKGGPIASPEYTLNSAMGHEMKIILWPGGLDGGSGTHITIALNIKTYRNDSRNPWTEEPSVRFSLLDRIGGMHLTHQIQDKTDWGLPGEVRCRLEKFVTHQELLNPDSRFIESDRIIIRVSLAKKLTHQKIYPTPH